ncbi:ribonuclease HII [Corynebacterium sp. HMSC062E11]|uniref:ribonuclease HII n=1 Tax=unclassified Corynebacterium TaxID=2624378 RepID=UPI0008A28AC0|nr:MULTISPECIES: ribonuclease HII [unclassified Corynebacterium]OFK30219.1 ribonuclease HII [Corynebacterium sp. HMSC062E11]OFS36907.1 ribonuclease HII [Corynebacterium sp. HMSC069E04]
MRRLKQKRTYEVALSKAGLGPVAGVDEAGRGACCGPITIAACILPDRILPGLERLDDSKKLTPAAREKLEPVIKRRALAWSVVHIGAKDIDAFGIQHANLSGMRRAVAQLGIRPGYVLSDALFVPGLPTPQLPIIAGDTAARCIAAASVLAKVSRDRLMVDVAKHYPGYALETHKGYGTAVHQDAIAQLGATLEHRMSYRNVAEAHARFLARA